MSTATTSTRVRAVIAGHAERPVDEVSDGLTLNWDLYFDSLDRVEIVMALEDEFGIEIPDKEFDPIKNVGEVVALVESKVKP